MNRSPGNGIVFVLNEVASSLTFVVCSAFAVNGNRITLKQVSNKKLDFMCIFCEEHRDVTRNLKKRVIKKCNRQTIVFNNIYIVKNSILQKPGFFVEIL
ncbi:hypothetical protein DSM106972_041000 [Dulcicalothrix desertica PCC 7102]|uniref:Uncharacterized protein n=1 Tax=Dulcicalothrix desertica PCC 7102 TaxID=232991 RepID=A0A433VGS8_9CYAN|nr:hypothetical protein DSM106972_041000 [Dulcicalothrix desertica PCC 7102]